MAPRKKTEEKHSASEAAELILDYLRKQNRPYSANDVSANLHNKVTKAAAAKILRDLHEQNKIEGRAAGKQIVYHAVQDPADSCTPEDLAALDAQVADLRNATAALKVTAKSLQSTLTELNSTLSTADLLASVKALEAEKAEMVSRLEGLRAGKAKKVTKRERDDVETEWKKWSGTAKKRQKISEEMWKAIEDILDGDKEKRNEVRESLGLDE